MVDAGGYPVYLVRFVMNIRRNPLTVKTSAAALREHQRFFWRRRPDPTGKRNPVHRADL
jgi:hypothetical protein